MNVAQDTVVACRRSLSTASEQIGAKSPSDGQLFLVRQLLILKEMTAGLDFGRAARERQWAGMGDFLRSLLENATSILGYGGRAPRVEPDAKADLDAALKAACEVLISQAVASSAASLTQFIEKAETFLATRAEKADLSQEEWATPAAVEQLTEEFRKTTLEDLTKWTEQLRLYLQDEETVRVLLPPAQAGIVESYAQFHDLIRRHYDFSTASRLPTPSAVAAQLKGE